MMQNNMVSKVSIFENKEAEPTLQNDQAVIQDLKPEVPQRRSQSVASLKRISKL